MNAVAISKLLEENDPAAVKAFEQYAQHLNFQNLAEGLLAALGTSNVDAEEDEGTDEEVDPEHFYAERLSLRNHRLEPVVQDIADKKLLHPEDITQIIRMIVVEDELVLGAFDLYMEDHDFSDLVDTLQTIVRLNGGSESDLIGLIENTFALDAKLDDGEIDGLKKLVFAGNDVIFAAYSLYLEDNDWNEFKDTLVRVITHFIHHGEKKPATEGAAVSESKVEKKQVDPAEHVVDPAISVADAKSAEKPTDAKKPDLQAENVKPDSRSVSDLAKRTSVSEARPTVVDSTKRSSVTEAKQSSVADAAKRGSFTEPKVAATDKRGSFAEGKQAVTDPVKRSSVAEATKRSSITEPKPIAGADQAKRGSITDPMAKVSSDSIPQISTDKRGSGSGPAGFNSSSGSLEGMRLSDSRPKLPFLKNRDSLKSSSNSLKQALKGIANQPPPASTSAPTKKPIPDDDVHEDEDEDSEDSGPAPTSSQKQNAPAASSHHHEADDDENDSDEEDSGDEDVSKKATTGNNK
eukprot:TRINITY_DN7262_c0_g1_i2.p1 TRINITY_DN7262_c0_g1~~TRINITY_DN7262_c0_g1_i2.p1  ORF type:complete len:584 (+),score=176.62 TRINITY_DN7262_c0_g1_i2:194-1753(+)